jgi:hypothetical protein
MGVEFCQQFSGSNCCLLLMGKEMRLPCGGHRFSGFGLCCWVSCNLVGSKVCVCWVLGGPFVYFPCTGASCF